MQSFLVEMELPIFSEIALQEHLTRGGDGYVLHPHRYCYCKSLREWDTIFSGPGDPGPGTWDLGPRDPN